MIEDNFPFLNLPVEIRLQIYSYLYVHPKLVVCRKPNSAELYALDDGNFHLDPRNTSSPCVSITTELLLTCHQIHAEASTVLYSGNIFGFDDPKSLLAFLKQIGQINNSHIKSLHIIVPWNQERWLFWPSELLLKLGSGCRNLRNVDLTLKQTPEYIIQESRSGGLGSHWWQEDTNAMITGRRMSLEFNLQLALAKLPGLEKVTVWGTCSEGWLDQLKEKLGLSVTPGDVFTTARKTVKHQQELKAGNL